MQDIFLLTQKDTSHPGYEVLDQVFTSQEALIAYLAQHIKLKATVFNGGILEPTFDKVYKIQQMKANADIVLDETPALPAPTAKLVEAKTEPELEKPFRVTTVPSQSLPNTYYSVSIRADGQVYACTCPDFTNRNHACKHMHTVCYKESPKSLGVPSLRIGQEFYTDPWSKAKQSQNMASSRYVGNAGSWRS